jgi:hypothetical protein
MLIYILAGSHGRLIFENREVLLGVTMAGTFLATAIFNWIQLIGFNYGVARFAKIALNIASIILIFYQVNILKPQTFTNYSFCVRIIHIVGAILGIFVTYKMIAYKKK